MTNMINTQPPPCPRCHSTNVIPIIYGLPSDKLLERLERGEIALGGCEFLMGAIWACTVCYERFGKDTVWQR